LRDSPKPPDQLYAQGHSLAAPASHLALIMLVELLRDLSRPVNREDSDEVGSHLRLILSSEGDLATKNSLSHSRFFRKQKVGRGKFSPLTAFDEAFGEWEAITGDCRPWSHQGKA